MDKYPVSVKAVIHKGGRFLVLRGTRSGESEFSFPGGLVEAGEPLKEALAREVLEETGYRVEVGEPFYAAKYNHPKGGENVVVCFRCCITGGKESLGAEADQVFLSLEWLSPAEVSEWVRKIVSAASR